VTRRSPAIAVLGSLHLDIVVQAPRQPMLGETLPARSWRRAPGGKGLNQAIHAARHGAEVRMFGCVGADDFAPPLLACLAANGVDAGGVRSVPAAGTGMSVAIIEDRGDYGAVIVSGANQCVDGTDVAAVAAMRPDVLLLQYEIALAWLAPAAAAARVAGARVVLNAAPATTAPDGLLGSIDLLVVNAVEAQMLTGIPVADHDDARRALAMLMREVPAAIVTLGPGGLVAAERGSAPIPIAGHTVAVVDAHGAGDALIGALACRLGAGDTLAEAARYANAAAALIVAAAGSDPGPASPERVARMLDEAGP
jgi:ribokinase